MIEKEHFSKWIDLKIRYYTRWVHSMYFWMIILLIIVLELFLFKSTKLFILNTFSWLTKQDSAFYLNIITIVYALFTIRIFYANKKSTELLQQQLASQRDQWLRDSFIKRECEIIAKAKELFDETEGSIYSFEGFYLSRLAFHTNPETGMIEKLSNNDYTYYYDKFKPLCTFYSANKEIFDSCGLKEGFEYLGCYTYLLSASKNAFEKDPELKETRYFNGLNRALFWYTFPVLIHKRFKEGMVVANPNYEQCWKEFTQEKFEEYNHFLVEARDAIHSMRKIFNKIMVIDLQNLK